MTQILSVPRWVQIKDSAQGLTDSGGYYGDTDAKQNQQKKEMPGAGFQELLPGNHKTHLLPPGQIMTTCHLPEKLVRDSVPRALAGAGPVGTSLSLGLQVQTPGRKAGVEYAPYPLPSGRGQWNSPETHVPSAAKASLVSSLS